VIEGHDLELFERSIRAATGQHTGAALDAALAELGWYDALAFDTRAAVSTLFGSQGESGATSSALDHVVAFGAGCAVDASTALALPDVGRWDPPGRLDGAGIAGSGAAVRGLLTTRQPLVLVVVADGDRVVAAVVDASSLAARSVHGVDPALGLVEIHGRIELDAESTEAVDWTAAVALAQLAVAHQLVGASRTALALAREHALERIQFGRPIAQFQAVRHKLAETLLAVEAADAVLDAAWIDRSPVTAAMAKATAGRSARTAARHCQQVLAGIGFTTEHDLHRFVRRILVLDQLFGAHDTLTKQLGEQLISTRTLPPFVAL
jgi:hypothetical protein